MLAFAATAHDPDGRILSLLRRHGPALAGYAAVAVAVTPQTAPAVATALAGYGAILAPGGPAIGESRRAALAAAAKRAPAATILTCDFDRWLVWRESEPAELADLETWFDRRAPAAWYACLGRTAAAFASHPQVQRVCESATNRALSLAAGRSLDATAGAALLRPPAVALVLEHSREASNATDLEWPALVLRRDRRRLAGRRCRGLVFETAAFHQADIVAAGGLAPWLAEVYDQPAMWARRLRLAADSAAALERVLGEAGTSPERSG
jgi:hypothetical protein